MKKMLALILAVMMLGVIVFAALAENETEEPVEGEPTEIVETIDEVPAEAPADEPVADEPAVEEPAGEEPVVQEIVTEEIIAEEPAAEETVADEAANEYSEIQEDNVIAEEETSVQNEEETADNAPVAEEIIEEVTEPESPAEEPEAVEDEQAVFTGTLGAFRLNSYEIEAGSTVNFRSEVNNANMEYKICWEQKDLRDPEATWQAMGNGNGETYKLTADKESESYAYRFTVIAADGTVLHSNEITITVIVPATEEETEEVAEEIPAEEETAEEETPAEEEVIVEETPAEEVAIVEEIPAEEEAIIEEVPAEEEVIVEETPAEEEVIAEEVPAEEEVIAEEVPAEEEVVEEVPAEEEVIVEEVPAEEEVVEEVPTEEEVIVEETPAEEEVIAEEIPAEEEAIVEEIPVEEETEEETDELADVETEDDELTEELEEDTEEFEEYDTALGIAEIVTLYTVEVADVRLDADGLSPIFYTLDKGVAVTTVGQVGDWIRVVVDDQVGFIYCDFLADTLPVEENTEEVPADEVNTEEVPAAEVSVPREMSVTIFSSRRTVMTEGEYVMLTSKLEGFDGLEVIYQWECDQGDGFQKVEDANNDVYIFRASTETLSWDWRLTVYYR